MTREQFYQMLRDALATVFVLLSVAAGLGGLIALTGENGRVPFWEAFFLLLMVFSALAAAFSFVVTGASVISSGRIDFKKNDGYQMAAAMFLASTPIALISWMIFSALRY